MEDENEIIIKDDTVKYVNFNGGISGITAVLVGGVNLFGKIALKKNQNQNWSTGNT